MNWSYISGFFDADGYVTISKKSTKENEIPYIGFTNTKLDILSSIQDFIFQQIGVLGHICTKQVVKENHTIGYDLKYSGFNKCISLSEHINTIHDKKKRRMNMFLDIHSLTPRNGKYTIEAKTNRDILVKQFLEIM